MSKYDGLAKYLAEIDGDSLTMSFSQINKLVTGGLPNSAYDYRPWWANRYDGNDAQNKGWQSVGWESSDVDMEGEKVTFNRVTKRRSDFQTAHLSSGLSIDEAKRGLSARFGIPVEQIDINIRG